MLRRLFIFCFSALRYIAYLNNTHVVSNCSLISNQLQLETRSKMLYLNVENSFFLINWHTITLSLIILMVILFLTRKSLKKNNGSKKHDDIIMYDNDKKFKTDSEDDIEGTTSSSLGSVNYIPYFSGAENLEGGANKFYKIMNKRRSIRSFSSEPIDVEIIKKCIQVAGSAPRFVILYFSKNIKIIENTCFFINKFEKN